MCFLRESGQAFAIPCPLAWNSLPDELYDEPKFHGLQKKIKNFSFLVSVMICCLIFCCLITLLQFPVLLAMLLRPY